MRFSATIFHHQKLKLGWFLFALLLMPSPVIAVTTVTQVHLGDSPNVIEIHLNGKTAFKTVQMDAREVLIAFQKTTLPEKVRKSGKGSHMVKQMQIDRRPNNVVALLFQTRNDIANIQAKWVGNSPKLFVRLVPVKQMLSGPDPIKHAKYQKKAAANVVTSQATAKPGPKPLKSPEKTAMDPVETQTAQAVDIKPAAIEPKKNGRSENADGLDNLLSEMQSDRCGQSKVLSQTLSLCREKKWRESYALLGRHFDPKGMQDCQESFYFLQAYLLYKLNDDGREKIYLEAVNYFQDAISYFPDSRYVPYAMLTLGKIYVALKNFAEAQGFFELVLKHHVNHPGRPMALYELGCIYNRQHRLTQAIETFNQLLAEYPNGAFTIDAQLGLGKALCESNEYDKALAVLKTVEKNNPEKTYEDDELLVLLGELYYQLGDYENARDAMIRAVNYYPEQEGVPVLLTRIADTFKETHQAKRADKLYQLVMNTHPGTDGYVLSAMRHADFVSDTFQKESIYLTIIKDYASHPMAKLAVVKLANLRYQDGQYQESIDTLRENMSANLRDLRKEASYVIALAYDGLFKQLTEAGTFTQIIAIYERDKEIVHRLRNPELFALIGNAFLQGHLYHKAAGLFDKSYKLIPFNKRPASIYYQLAVAYQEIGKAAQAKEMMFAYLQKIPKTRKHAEAYLRMARMHMARKEYAPAVRFIKTAYDQSLTDGERAKVLMVQSEALQAWGKPEHIPPLMIKTINLLAADAHQHIEALLDAYQLLGESYLKMSQFESAADAFTMALKFSETGRPPDLLFFLGDAYMKGNASAKAKDIFTEIVTTGDSFWVHMAQNRLRSIEIEAKLNQA
ncbi:MAG: tetratricopeptide repeat protein [Deltaproteobacteria bacterium]|nr:tetratricopeptide repeat protein [Deltaproteobacteria bacterium]